MVQGTRVLFAAPVEGVRWDQSDLVAGQVVIEQDAFRNRSHPWSGFSRSLAYRSVLSVPIRVGGEVWGAVSVAAAEPGAFNMEEVRVLEEAARTAGLALER